MAAEKSIVEKLVKLKIFKEFKNDPHRLDKVVALLKEEKYQKGEYVLQEGEMGSSLFIIKTGTVRVEKTTLEDDNYTVVILRDKENVFFGEICLLEDTQRTASVICEEDCEFLILERDDFNKLCSDDSYLGLIVVREISKILAARLKKADDDIITLFNALVSEVELH